MGIPLIVLGALLVVAGWQDQIGYLATNLETDISGWLKWALAIGAIGALGAVPGMRKPAFALLALVIVVLIVANNKAVFSNLQSLSPTAPPAPQPAPFGQPSAPPASSAGATETGSAIVLAAPQGQPSNSAPIPPASGSIFGGGNFFPLNGQSLP